MQVVASVNSAPAKLLVRTKLGSATHHPKRSRVRPLTAAWSGFSNSKAPEPVWVETHKGVPNVAVVKPDTPCKVCLGKGKVTCGTCEGKGTPRFLPHIYRALQPDSAAFVQSPIRSHATHSHPHTPAQQNAFIGLLEYALTNYQTHIRLQAERTGCSIECYQVGCGQHGARAVGAVVSGIAKGTSTA